MRWSLISPDSTARGFATWPTRSRLHLEGYRVAAINNFSNFGVDRKVIYCRTETERVATRLDKEIISGAELAPVDRGLTVSRSR